MVPERVEGNLQEEWTEAKETIYGSIFGVCFLWLYWTHIGPVTEVEEVIGYGLWSMLYMVIIAWMLVTIRVIPQRRRGF